MVSGVEDGEVEPAPVPGLPTTPLLSSPFMRSRLGTEPTRSGWPRTPRAAHAPPDRPSLAPSSGRTCQAISWRESYTAGRGTPQWQALPHWIGQGPRGESPDRLLIARPPLTHPQPHSASATGSQHPPSFSATAPVQGQTSCPMARCFSSRARAYAQTATGHC